MAIPRVQYWETLGAKISAGQARRGLWLYRGYPTDTILDEFRRSKVLQASAGAGFRLAALVESGQIWEGLAIWPGWGAKKGKKGQKGAKAR